HPPRVRIPASQRIAVLRLQARQRDPDRGHAEADRPRRGLPHGRHGEPDLRHAGLPGTRDRRHRANRALRPVHRGADARGSLLVASDDPGAGFLAAIAGVTDPDELASLLAQAPQRTVEVKLREARAAIDGERFSDADALLAEVEAEDPWDWRVGWYRGLGFLH